MKMKKILDNITLDDDSEVVKIESSEEKDEK